MLCAPARWSARRCCGCRRRRSAPSCRPAPGRRWCRSLERLRAASASRSSSAGAGRARSGRAAARGADLLDAIDRRGQARARSPRVVGQRRVARRRAREVGARAAALEHVLHRRPAASASGQARIEHHAVDARVAAAPPGPRPPVATAVDADVAAAEQRQRAARAAARRARRPAGRASAASTIALDRVDDLVERLAGLAAAWDERRARPSSQAALGVLVGEMTYTGMWRVVGSCLRRSSTRQPSMSGSEMSSVMASGVNSRASAERGGAERRDEPLEAVLVGRVEQEAANVRSFSTISSDAVAGLDGVARSSPSLVDERRRRGLGEHGGAGRGVAGGCGDASGAGGRRAAAASPAACTSLRQVERERAALPGRAGQADLAAQQPRDLAADRQAQAGAAVLAAGAAVGLLEGLEDDLLLVRRDADAGVGDGEGEHRAARGSAPSLSELQPPRRRPDRRASPGRAR